MSSAPVVLSSRLVGIFAIAAAMLAPAALAQTESKPKAPTPPALYDTKADARVDLKAAVARANRENARVLVMFGFNTCGWCHKLHGLFEKNAEIRKILHDEYTTVMVDTSAPHAAEMIAECKAVLSKEELQKGVGYPFLAVFDGNGKIVTAQRTDPLEEGDHHDPIKVKEFLTKWVAPAQDAREVLGAALTRAVSEDKQLLLHFGAPWCGWCHRLDDFLAREEIAAIIGRDYIDLKIDVDRMKNGKDVEHKFRADAAGGIPWIAILDSGGKTLATSDGPKGNIGYPAEPAEIDHFLGMLAKTRKRIEPAQIDQIKQALQDAAAKMKEGARTTAK